jgi:hypothetical protein
VNPGITGKFHGYFVIPLPPNEIQTSNDPHCNALLMTNSNCTTTTFIDTHFTPACYVISGAGGCPVTTFFFHYTAKDQGLVMHDWTNASPDVGGNKGDIRSGPPLPCPKAGDETDSKQQQHGELCEEKGSHGEQDDGPASTEDPQTEQAEQNQQGTDHSGEDLNNADYSGYNFSGANLKSADLSGSSLKAANLSGANLSCANLSSADLTGAVLAGAILSGANLAGANLQGVDLSGVINDGSLVCGGI